MTLTVAILFVVFGSSVSAMVAAFAVIVVPVAAVTFTVRRTVQVVFGAMLAFSWQTIWPAPPDGGSRPAHRGSAKGSFWVWLPSRAGLMLKSMANMSTVATVHAASVQRLADKVTTAQ